MEKREPYNLKTFISYYNIFQIITNTWIVYAFVKNGMFTEISLNCDEFSTSAEGKPMGVNTN